MDDAQITTVYNTLLTCMQGFHVAGELLIERKARLETARLSAMRDGLITGKNEDERKMSAYTALPDLYREVAEAELKERQAKYSLDCAQVIVEQTRALLRLEEIRRQQGMDVEVMAHRVAELLCPPEPVEQDPITPEQQYACKQCHQVVPARLFVTNEGKCCTCADVPF